VRGQVRGLVGESSWRMSSRAGHPKGASTTTVPGRNLAASSQERRTMAEYTRDEEVPGPGGAGRQIHPWGRLHAPSAEDTPTG
jgi:hypothetical protein